MRSRRARARSMQFRSPRLPVTRRRSPGPCEAMQRRSRRFGAKQIAMREIEPQVEFDLMVARLHQFTQPIERLVVIALLQMRELMHDDHPKKLGRGVPE